MLIKVSRFLNIHSQCCGATLLGEELSDRFCFFSITTQISWNIMRNGHRKTDKESKPTNHAKQNVEALWKDPVKFLLLPIAFFLFLD